MKRYLIAVALMLMFAISSQAQVMVSCDTSGLYSFEQQQAKYNQDKAKAIVVINTASQQLQCHHQQLATYWQQKHKDNQQIAKDIQQKAKDAQQIAKDAQQIATDKTLAERTACLNTVGSGYDELLRFVEVILPHVGDCSIPLRNDLSRIKTNRSGHADGTSPGGQTQNIRGFDNPGYVIAR